MRLTRYPIPSTRLERIIPDSRVATIEMKNWAIPRMRARDPPLPEKPVSYPVPIALQFLLDTFALQLMRGLGALKRIPFFHLQLREQH